MRTDEKGIVVAASLNPIELLSVIRSNADELPEVILKEIGTAIDIELTERSLRRSPIKVTLVGIEEW